MRRFRGLFWTTLEELSDGEHKIEPHLYRKRQDAMTVKIDIDTLIQIRILEVKRP